MFSMSYTRPKEPVGTIYCDKRPQQLGPYTDIYGNRWDIQGIYYLEGKQPWVQAVPDRQLHPYFGDTSMRQYRWVGQTWEPYLIEVVVREPAPEEKP